LAYAIADFARLTQYLFLMH